MTRSIPALFLFALALNAQDSAVKVREDSLSLPTYDEGAPDPNPQFDAFYRAIFPNYPYTIRRPLNKTRSMIAWRVLVLENEYLSCRVLPDLGGHLHGCTDRITGKEIFYSNPAIRPGPQSMRGTFIATGIESSFPFAHSRVSGSPVDFAWSVLDRVGRVVVEDTDRTSGMTWRVEFILRPGSAVLEQRVTLYNGSAVRRGYHWWVNAEVELDDPHLRLIYPVKWMLPHGDGAATPWPISETGIDLSDVANHKDAIGLFAHASHEPWIAVYKPKFRSGVAHYANPDQVKGKKLWVWGAAGDASVQETLTEKFNSYVEMQAGEFETQPEFAFLLPEETKTFSHYWIPFHDLGGVSRATPDAVLNVSRNGGAALVELMGTRVIRGATIRVSDGANPVFEARLDLDPKVKYAKTLDGAPARFIVDVVDAQGVMLLHHSAGPLSGEYDSAPFDKNANIKDPDAPAGNTAVASLERGAYNEQRDLWSFASHDYESGLRATPGSAPLVLAGGRAAFALNRYDDAIRSLEGLVDSSAEAAWYAGAALANKSQRIPQAQAALNRAAKDPSYARAARLELALVAARENGATGMAEATGMLQKLAAEPAAPVRVGALEVAMLRRVGRLEEARSRLKFWLNQDPANLMLRVERSLLESADDISLWRHLGADPERVLNVAEEYRQLGDWNDALRLLDRRYPAAPANEREPGSVLPQDNPLVIYYRGYCRLKAGGDPKPDFQLASTQSVRYVFPHREIETVILEAALAQNDNDAVAHALLGDLYFASLRTDQAIAEWQNAYALQRDLPALARNLGRALLDIKNDAKQASPILLEGNRLDPDNSEIKDALKRLSGAEPPRSVTGTFSAEAPKGDEAERALVKSATDPDGAVRMFNARTFPKEKQPDNVRRAYIEVQLQRLLALARAGNCTPALTGVETLGAEDVTISFTLYGFDSFMKSAHFQYYLGVVESSCGAAKAAQKRWLKVSKSKERAESPDFVFPYLAAQKLGEPDARARIDAAVQTLKSVSPGNAGAVAEFGQGALLMKAGKIDQGDLLLRKALQDGEPFVRYLCLTELAEAARK